MENLENPYEQQERRTRNKFIQKFGKYFNKIKETEMFCSWDLECTGSTFIQYIIEIKERSEEYSIYKFSGKTWIEEIKLNAFKEQLNKNPKLKCLYFVFFPDGYISYDISGRYEAHTSEVLYTFTINDLPSTTLTGTSRRPKKVGCLAANPIEYMDKIKPNK